MGKSNRRVWFFPNILYYDNSEEGNCLGEKKKICFNLRFMKQEEPYVNTRILFLFRRARNGQKMSAQLERGRAQTMRGFSCVCAGMLLMALPTGPPASYGDRGINRDSWKMASVLYFSSKPVLSST